MSIQLRLADALGVPGTAARYRLCGIEIRCDVPLPSLSPFEVDGPRAGEATVLEAEPWLCASRVARCETRGVTGGLERRVVLETGPGGARIDIEGFGRYMLNTDGSVVALERLAGPTAVGLLEDCTLGPPLIVSLALRGCWFLHAAAVLVDGRAAAIAGPSGSGKSTLAARLDRAPGCRRMGDDLLGLRWDGQRLLALGDYPQLKLSPAQQWRQPPLNLDTVYLLRPAMHTERFAVRVVEKSEKLLVLTRHGVSSTLFPAPVLERHLAFCRNAAEAATVVEIVYPRNENALERAVDEILTPGPAGAR